MSDLFGTDGVRGKANDKLTPELATKLGHAISGFARKGEEVFICRDTRRSGDMLKSALASGMASSGIKVRDLGVAPTPAVPLMGRKIGMELGAVVSASHNLAGDNGIKFFDSKGFKIPIAWEEKIENLIRDDFKSRAAESEIGRIFHDRNGLKKYVDYLIENAVPENFSTDLNIVLDCANGATYRPAPELFERIGANVKTINAEPDGDNINLDCGSTNMDGLSRQVVEDGADLGVGFDGDGDRALFVDEDGEKVDGDHVLYIAAKWLKNRGDLVENTVVSTVMSNLGFEKSLKKEGIKLIRTGVGDRFVAKQMKRKGLVLGGEQSGHIIFRNVGPTGDGLATALKILLIITDKGKSLSDLKEGLLRYPQVLENVEVKRKDLFSLEGKIGEKVKDWEGKLGEKGRVLVRASGTQPVIRVMVESKNEKMAHEAAGAIATVVDEILNP